MGLAGILNHVTAAQPRACAFLVTKHWDVVQLLITLTDTTARDDSAAQLQGICWGMAIIRNLCRHALEIMDYERKIDISESAGSSNIAPKSPASTYLHRARTERKIGSVR